MSQALSAPPLDPPAADAGLGAEMHVPPPDEITLSASAGKVVSVTCKSAVPTAAAWSADYILKSRADERIAHLEAELRPQWRTDWNEIPEDGRYVLLASVGDFALLAFYNQRQKCWQDVTSGIEYPNAESLKRHFEAWAPVIQPERRAGA